jgi:hypothetical protein
VPRPIPTDPELATAVNELRDSIIRHLTYVGAAPRGAKRKAQQLVDKAAAGAPLDAAAAAEAAADLAAIIEVKGDAVDSNGIGKLIVESGIFAKVDDAMDAAAHEVIKVYPHLSAAERAELCDFAKVKGWKVQRSGAVFKHFGAHPTGTKHRCWMAANIARKSAEAAFKLKNQKVRLAKAADKNQEKARNEIRDRLTQLAPLFLKNKYMLGDEFSMLDVALAPLLWRLDHYGIELSKTAAPLMKYAERIFSRPAYIEALTPSEKVMRR